MADAVENAAAISSLREAVAENRLAIAKHRARDDGRDLPGKIEQLANQLGGLAKQTGDLVRAVDGIAKVSRENRDEIGALRQHAAAAEAQRTRELWKIRGVTWGGAGGATAIAAVVVEIVRQLGLVGG